MYRPERSNSSPIWRPHPASVWPLCHSGSLGAPVLRRRSDRADEKRWHRGERSLWGKAKALGGLAGDPDEDLAQISFKEFVQDPPQPVVVSVLGFDALS